MVGWEQHAEAFLGEEHHRLRRPFVELPRIAFKSGCVSAIKIKNCVFILYCAQLAQIFTSCKLGGTSTKAKKILLLCSVCTNFAPAKRKFIIH